MPVGSGRLGAAAAQRRLQAGRGGLGLVSGRASAARQGRRAEPRGRLSPGPWAWRVTRVVAHTRGCVHAICMQSVLSHVCSLCIFRDRARYSTSRRDTVQRRREIYVSMVDVKYNMVGVNCEVSTERCTACAMAHMPLACHFAGKRNNAEHEKMSKITLGCLSRNPTTEIFSAP